MPKRTRRPPIPPRHYLRRTLRELQTRAEAMTCGDFQSRGQPVGGPPELENLRRAIDVMGEHLEQAQRTMHTYIAAVTTAQEAERGRLARELHDETVQQLIVLAQGVDRLGRVHERTPERVPEVLATLRSDITTLIHAVRVTIANLRPPALEELGLLPAVELFLQPWAATPPVVTIVVEGSSQRLDPESELAVFRIIQEAWSNIRRHAQATRASVSLTYERGTLRVTISDNGLGFTPPRGDAAEPGHWGILGMRERAALAGGSLLITSAPGHGAQVVVTMPYPGVGNRDHVCGMAVRPSNIGVMYQDRVYRFCSLACKDLFRSEPERYLPSV